jgi:hypothetical protein
MTEQSGTRQPGASNPFLRARPKDAAADPTGAPGTFPQVRMRRNRSSAWSRRLVAENRLSVDDFIWPVFVQEDAGTTAVESMPGVLRYGLDRLVDAIGPAFEAGIPAVELFPYLSADVKTPDCREAVNPDNLVCRAVRAVKAAFPDLGIVTDVALDPFNSDGHDGLLKDGKILNDESLELLAEQALVQARAGSDIVAPSDMMDGRSTRRAWRRLRSFPTAPNMRAPSTAPSARPSARAGFWPATRRPTRWTRPTATRRCARWPWTWARAPTW